MGVKIREKPKGSGIYWLFIYHHGKRKSKRAGTDLAVAREAAKKIQARLILGEYNMERKASSVSTFQSVSDLWIKQPHDWKDSTRDSYELNLKNHILPSFGKTPIDEIKRKDLKAFFDRKYSEGLTPGTLNLVRAPLNGVLSYAVDLELIDSNPLRDLTLKYKRQEFEIEPLTEKESLRLLDQAKTFMEGAYYPVVLCALRTGMRIGEIQALRWSDIDFDGREIEVKRSYRKRRLTDTKSHKRRRVDMTRHLAETLQRHRTHQKRQALKIGIPLSDYVFTGTRDELLNRISFQNALNKCTKGAELRRIRTHDLRHSYATIRLMKGHNVGDVSYQLGHSSIKITYDVYTHWIPGKFKSEVDELDNMHQNSGTVQNPANGCV